MKLLIDECIGKNIYGEIKTFLDSSVPPIQHMHMLDFNGRQGLNDEEWVPKAAAEGWFVITGDSGRSRLGAPLHLLLPQYKISAIFFSGKLQSKPGLDKVRAILSVLPRLETLATKPPGTRWKLYLTINGYGIKEWPRQPER